MNDRSRNLIVALIWATSITLLCALGVFRSPELWLQDKLYQQPVNVPDDIVIIGIDENDIKEFGPTNSWDRSVMARALEALASDPDRRPAVVAIDVQYSGTMNEEGDERLVKAAKELGNVGVSFDVIFKLCEVLEITPKELFDFRD